MTAEASTSDRFPSTTAAEASHRRLQIGFLNWAHALDHFVILIYPTVVIELQAAYGRSYSALIALSTASFIAFGLFSLPAGWLADRWSRRNMMAAFYVGCGLSLIGAALAPSLWALAVALFALGVFAAGGFGLVLGVTAVVAFGFLIAVLAIAYIASGVERARVPQPVPAE